MRWYSIGLFTALALGCGDGDQSTIDPNFLNPSPGAGPGEESSGAPGGGTEPGVEKPGSDEPVTATEPALACGAAMNEACSVGGSDENAASTDGKLPEDGSGESGGDGGSTGAGAASGAGETGSAGDGSSGEVGAAGEGGSAGDGSGGAPGDGGAPGNGEGGNGEGGSGAEAGPLPDLILDDVYLMATIQQDFVDAAADQCLFNEGCVTGEGRRRVVRFGTRSANVGTADVIVGEPVAGNPLWEFDACHEHFHFEGYARYDLVEASSGEVLPIGNKNGFCLRDLDNWSNPSCATYDCDYQGISVGCADVYTPDLDCQWVDITDVAPGTYELVVSVNTERSIRELSFENNSARVTIEIESETVRIVP
jgi:hypothetical protein